MTGFWAQANALFRKNLTFQKKNIKTNLRLLFFPIVLCLLLMLLQSAINNQLDKPSSRCGCKCIGKKVLGQCHDKQVCGIEYSDDSNQAALCPTSSPFEWPPLLQMPNNNFFFERADSTERKECARHGTCPVSVLITARNRSFIEGVAGTMFPNSSDFSSFSGLVLASESQTAKSNFLEPAFTSSLPIYYVQSQCGSNSTSSIAVPLASVVLEQEVKCVQGQNLWRNSESEIIDELYVEHKEGYPKKKTNEILAGYDFLNSDINNYHVTVWYSSHKDETASQPHRIVRVPRLINLVSNAFLQLVGGRSTHMLFDFVKEMPKHETETRMDFSSLLGPLFFTWVILQLFPIVLTALVYEKQQNLRIMMKMHGLGDGPYVMISYAYFLAISVVYMFCFVVFGSAVGLNFFTLNDYSIQFVFYFIYVNLQIALAFLGAAFFSNVKTAAVVGYITVFATGLLGGFFFQPFLQDKSFSRVWIIVMELYPGFSLYAGLYEFSQYAFYGAYSGAVGMQWGDLSDSSNNMAHVLIIMVVEWFLFFLITYYIDQGVTSETGVRKSPLFFLKRFKQKSTLSSLRNPDLHRQGSNVHLQLEKPNVVQERERVEPSLVEQDTSHSILCDNLKKVYPGRDGNPEKCAVRGLSLALSQGECFGMLGPNGAGKSSFINMMIGLMKPSSGTAYVQGMDIRSNMDQIYANMGVCPQHDLLWETLTGREHLLFYGRLKNLRGSALTQAVEESLKSVNLFNGGVADKQAGKYSGGMKRRLSVAISLIGDPKVVYMDEPSTGLDPASRNNLWNVVKRAKQNRAIILTTHSMEEAEHLCDRLGIFVDGSLQCIGNPKELKGRYGGSYVFTMTTSSNHETDVENLVKGLSPNANKIYQISGTQKFDMPKQGIKIADVFRAVENAKSRFTVQAWGLADTTLEDVFIKVAREAQPKDVLS